MGKTESQQVFPPEPGKQENYLHEERKNHEEKGRIMYNAEKQGSNNYNLVSLEIYFLELSKVTGYKDKHDILLEKTPKRIQKQHGDYTPVKNRDWSIYLAKDQTGKNTQDYEGNKKHQGLSESFFPEAPFFKYSPVINIPVNNIPYPEEAYPCNIKSNHI